MRESELSVKVLGKEYTPEQLNKIFLEFETRIRKEESERLGAYYRNKRKLTKRIKKGQRLEFFNLVSQNINDHIAEVKEKLYDEKIL